MSRRRTMTATSATRRRAPFAMVLVAGLVARSHPAHADESALEAIRFPAPFALPTLEHDRLDLRFDTLVGRVAAPAPRTASAGGIMRPSVEGSILVPRQLYVGLTWPFAAALPPDGGLAPGEVGRPSGARAMLGNVEGHVRAVFPLPQSLEIGFILAAAAPTTHYDRDSRGDRSAVAAFASFDPTNYVQFLPDRIGLRPAGDLRVVRGPIVVQGRHGIDIFIDSRGRESVKVAGRLLLHVGWLIQRDTELSVEATQSYFFSSDDQAPADGTPATAFADKYRVSDGHRSAITIGPGFRVSFHDADVGAALVTNLSDPLSPVAGGFVALNLSVIGHAGPHRRIEQVK